MFPNAQLTFCTFEAAGLPGGEGAGALAARQPCGLKGAEGELGVREHW